MTKEQLSAFENFLEWLDSRNQNYGNPIMVGEWTRHRYHKWYKEICVSLKHGEEYWASVYLLDADQLDYQAACGTAISLLSQNYNKNYGPNPITVYRNEYGQWLWTTLQACESWFVDIDKDADELSVLTKVCQERLSVQ